MTDERRFLNPPSLAVAFLAASLALLPGCSRPADQVGESGSPSKSPASSGPNAVVAGPVVDDFSDPDRNSLGHQRQFIDDTSAGGRTRTQYRVEGGILSATGEIIPPRGQPGWASAVLLLDAAGLPRDVSSYTGLRLRVRVNRGSVSISANSPEVTNFDYHAAPVVPPADGGFHEIRIPFAQLKRAWSEPTPLNPRTVASLSLVAFGVQPDPFDYAVDEVGFY